MRTFGHQRAVRDEDGEIIGSKPSPVRARTIETLGAAYGPDRNRRLIVTLAACDVITIRPEKTTRGVDITAKDLYAYAQRTQAFKDYAHKAIAKKQKKAERLARERQKRAEKRLVSREVEQ